MKDVTLCYLTKQEDGETLVCLAMKKRGFGEGYWNAPGGKVKIDEETIEEGVKREVLEEIGTTVDDLDKRGILDFTTMKLRCHVFFANDWDGEPQESEEMAPQWFKLTEVPYHEMWDDDKLWLERIIAGDKIKGTFIFDGNNKLLEHTIETVESF